MLIRIAFVEISPTQIAEVGVAFEADHVVASMRLLSSSITCRARLRMKFHVVFRCLLFGRELKLATGEAGEVFAMPAGFADLAESEVAVFADCEAFGWWRQFLLRGVPVVGLRFFGPLHSFIFFFIWFALTGTSWSLTPLARAIDRRSIRFKAFLPLQLDVTLDCILFQRYL